jgi:DMSO/TMAO reductase YedYZ molybdopterin-dependent catalytic subunit
VRIVAPGFPGSAWQKWLTRIWVRDREHDGPKMTGTDYRMPLRTYAPGQKIDERDFAVIEELPTKTLITHPGDGTELKVGEPVELRGFAWSGYGAITGVKVSFDGSRFQPAELEPAADRFAWYRFRATFTPTRPGPALLIARATDEMGRVQPLGEAAWNPRGYLNDRAHQVIVIVRE